MDWFDLVQRQPGLAALAKRQLIAPGVVLVATIRRDGTPRLSPVEPLVIDGQLWLLMMLGSRKAADLDRGPRVLVHSVITSRDGGEGELKLRGLVRAWPDPQTQGRYAETAARTLGWLAAGAGPFPPLQRRHRADHVHPIRRGIGRPARGFVAAGPPVRAPRHLGDDSRRTGARIGSAHERVTGQRRYA
jgi:hypothetical protein